MPVSGRLSFLLVVAAIGSGLVASDASAGLDPGLCHSTRSRAAIPTDFGVDACFDGTDAVLRNQLTLVLDASKTGDVGNPKRQESDIGLAADAVRRLSKDPDIFLPGDELTYPVGPGAGTLQIRGSSDNGSYAIATTIADFFPGKPAAWVNSFTTLVAELDDDYAKYQKCIAGKNWIGQLGCDAVRTRDVGFAVGRAGASGFSTDLIEAILAPATWAKWADASVKDSKTSLTASGLIRIAAAPANPPRPPPSAKPKPQPAPSTSTSQPPPSEGSLAVGSSFASWCVVAWPTAPVISSEGIEMTMSCDAVPEDEYLFTEVFYEDPDLPVSPEHARAYVVGKVADVAHSEYGYDELVVEASSVRLE
jgi:hypothetical protein